MQVHKGLGLSASRMTGVVAAIAAAVLALTLVSPAVPATAAGTSAVKIANHQKPVPGAHAAPVAAGAAPASSTSLKVSATSLGAGTSSSLQIAPAGAASGLAVKVSGGRTGKIAGSWHRVGSSPVQLAPVASPTSSSAAGASPSPAATPVAGVSASVLSAAQAKKRGLRGLVITLHRTDGGTGTAPVAVDVPISVLSGLYGAGYASRVRWVQVPGATSTVTSKQLLAAPSVPATPATQTTTGVSAAPAAATAATASAQVLTANVSAATTTLTAVGTPVSSAGTGNFAATSLKPSSTWQVSAQTGDFSWSYPLRTPPAAAGPAPDLALQYDSQSIDGETGSTNNQPSSIGEGWSLSGGGFIERTYVSCSDDDGSSGPVTTSGDLCWKTDNATLSLGGQSGQLVKDSTTGAWKLQDDDGSRIQHLVGAAAGCGAANGTYDDDCWLVTTTDGTKYYFGLNELPGYASGDATTNSAWTVPVFGNDPGEPGHASTFAASALTQAWRWNLDYVQDPNGNAEALYYNTQTNEYSKDGTTATSYVRGGELNHIDYGIVAGKPYAANAASDKVVFAYGADGRCVTGCTAEAASGAIAAPATPANYPDVPFDQECISGTCAGLDSPTFFSTSMLSTVTTEDLVSGTYTKVDSWALGHSFPNPGDTADGTTAALWLTNITHTGYTGTTSLAEPPTVFSGATYQNRVWVTDGLAPLMKYRITAIKNSTGAITSVTYTTSSGCTPTAAAAIEASPQSNTLLCFPQYWSPGVLPYVKPKLDLFYKYVVSKVINTPETGGGYDQAQETDYDYTGTPAWRYDTSPLVPDDQRTWNVYAGYNTVEVRVGNSSTPSTQETTDYTFYQGMDGDRASSTGGTKSVSVTGSSGVPDSLWLAGQVREEKVLNGVGGAVVSDTVDTPWAGPVTANDGTNTARMVEDGTDVETQPVAAGGSRTITTTNTYDSTYGLLQTTQKDTSDAGDTCTTNTYASPNTTAWIIGLTQQTSEVAVPCAQVATSLPVSDAISDTVNYYGSTAVTSPPPASPQAAPSNTEVMAIQEVDSYTGSTLASPHWVTESTNTYDALGRTTSTTDVLGHKTSTAYTPAAAGPLTAQVVTNPAGWTSTTDYNPAWGVETSATDQNGNTTTATYDALGRRVAVWLPIRPQASNATPSIGYAYTESQTAASSVATTVLRQSTTSTSYQLYDGLGQLVQTQAPSEAGGSMVTDTAYDAAGRSYMVNNAYWTDSVSPSAVLFVPASEQEIASEDLTTYDGDGRTATTTLQSGGGKVSETSYTYEGDDTVVEDPPAGSTPTSTVTNSLGEKTSLTQYLAATATGTATQETTSYSYDPSGNMVKMVDPSGNTWRWGYDVLGDQVTASDPDTGTTTSSYDDAGDLLSTTDARGVELSYTYDNLQRKTAEYEGTAGASGTELDSWVYDSLAKGQLTSSTSYVGSKAGTPGAAYTEAVTGYNASYQPTGQTISIPQAAPAFGGTSYTTKATYYQDGSQRSESDPAEGGLAAETIGYAYDTDGNLASLTGSTDYVTGVAYSAIGQPTEYNRGTGVVHDSTAYSYDQATGLVIGIGDEESNGSTNSEPAQRSYTRDASGNVTEAQNVTNAGTDTQCYTYDYQQNLTAAWTPSAGSCTAAPSSSALGGPAPYWESFTYDPATGNRLSEMQHATTATGTDQMDTYAYPVAGAADPHGVTSITSTQGSDTQASSLTYDADGDTTSLPGGVAATYDPQGKLSSTTSAGGVVQSNVYDANGTLLLQSDSSTGTTLFLGDTELHVAAGSSAVSAVRTYSANGVPVAERTTSAGSTTATLYWLSADVDGTVDLEINATTGAVTHRFTDPFGNARGVSPAWSDDHTFLNDATSSLTGLVQVGARVYDPALGRFLSVDPLLDPGNLQQVNGYTYAGNNPVTNTDATGNIFQGPPGSGESASGGQTTGPGWVSPSNYPPPPGNTGGGSGGGGGSSHHSSSASGDGGQGVSNHRVGATSSTCGRFGFCGGVHLSAQEEAAANREGWALVPWFAIGTAEILTLGADTAVLPEEAGAAAGADAAEDTTARIAADKEAAAAKMSAIRATGRSGEDDAGIDQSAKLRIPSASGTASYRIPDSLSDTDLLEVKNVSQLSFTNQLRDFYQYAQSTGRSFTLVTRSDTSLSNPLQSLINNGRINLQPTLQPGN